MSNPSIRVFVVDDDATVPRLLELALPSVDDGLEIVGHAADAAAARDSLGNLDADVVVIDHQLPDQNGVDLGRSLAGERPGIAMILWSGTRSAELRSEAIDAGFRDVITKDDLDELAAVIRAAV
ncbi:MAG: response regulator [Acidimicrobiia bacterium]|nr:response regulator [Acidimicrobiia bacterium]